MNPQRKSFLRGCGVAVAMFGFGFALVPLYSVVCDLVGFNGRAAGTVSAAEVVEQVDESRTVTIEFLTTVNGGQPWVFAPETQRLSVHPGKLYTVNFSAANPHDAEAVAQAVPSVVPWNAAKYLHKTECFCFRQQTFAAGEHKQMPVRFMLDRDLPADVQVVTLSYTFFDVTQTAALADQGPTKTGLSP